MHFYPERESKADDVSSIVESQKRTRKSFHQTTTNLIDTLVDKAFWLALLRHFPQQKKAGNSRPIGIDKQDLYFCDFPQIGC